ncbi:MAG: copper resistance protein CopC [Caulobacteraceae bacterium]|nr:copper resistance protein CopC [Caulobacteraceae bacterium]
MTVRKSSTALAALALTAGLAAAATQADAHAAFVSATPAANATVAAPKQITVRLSEKLAPKFSSFDLMKTDGSKVPVKAAVAPKDKKTLVAAVPATLAPGTYRVMWHAVAADDGHPSKGDFNFTVR